MPPRITFGIIVLNGEPFTRYNLRSLYPFAHQIVVVEGASPHAACIATADGHSTDGTLEVLRRFKAEEDPENKLQIVTAEDCGHPNGFWPGEKDEQSQAYATRTTGDWLWQVDIDEFYRPGDMRAVVEMLRADASITGASFRTLFFWGAPEYRVDGRYLLGDGGVFHRLFRFGPGYRYTTHRPPTVVDPQGRDLRAGKWLSAKTLEAKGVRLFHYALLFPGQVREKCSYYVGRFPNDYAGETRWAEDCYFQLRDPYRVHNVYKYPSWLERFVEVHPPEVLRMMEDARAGRIPVELRQNDDVERLLGSIRYRMGRAVLRSMAGLGGGERGLVYSGLLAPFRRLARLALLGRQGNTWK